jgi:hypothetical protein
MDWPGKIKHVNIQKLEDKSKNSENFQQLAARPDSNLNSINLRKGKQLPIHNRAGSSRDKCMQLRQIRYNAS